MATHAHTTDTVRRSPTRRAMLLGAAVLPGAAPLASPLPPNPDAEFISLCSRHPALMNAVNASTIDGAACPA